MFVHLDYLKEDGRFSQNEASISDELTPTVPSCAAMIEWALALYGCSSKLSALSEPRQFTPHNGSNRCIAEVPVGEVGGSDQTVCDTKGTEDTYQIVGIDDANVQEKRTI